MKDQLFRGGAVLELVLIGGSLLLASDITVAASINLAWDTSPSANVGGYSISYGTTSGAYNTAVDVGNVTSTTISGLTAGTTYYFAARTYDAAKTVYSTYSNQVSATPAAAADSVAPTIPASLVSSAVSFSQINLSWSASTDNEGVTGYLVERCLGTSCTTFTQIGTAASPTYSSTGLAASTTYRYRVRAYDAAGNLSGYSSILTVSTTAAADTAAPTVPAGLAATAVSSSAINLSWTASTDNVGVSGYLLERCSGSGCTNFAQIAVPTSTSYADTGLAASTTYRYRMRARDAAGNVSGYSIVAAAATAAGSTNPPPLNPTGCTSNCTIWPSTAVPNTVDDRDPQATEVGVKFTSDIGGKITGIRFYKGSANTGTHVGNLWTADGTRLASATFDNETASGWQQVNFSTPVPITANTVYVASYFAPGGHYSADPFGLNANVDRAPLHALGDNVAGPDGLYAYGSASSFPQTGWNAANYWVDVVFTADTTAACTPVGNGLVAAYGFEENSGATVADQSGNCNTGTRSGTTRVANGRFGKALSFNGASDWVTVPDSNSLDLTTDMTLEAWVNPARTLSGWVGVLFKETRGGAVYDLVANSASSQPHTGLSTTGQGWWEISGGSALAPDTWTHLAATYESSTGVLRLYVNGNFVARAQGSGGIDVSSGVFRIGGHSLWGEFFTGLIDEVRVYNRRLAGTEIRSDMNVPVRP